MNYVCTIIILLLVIFATGCSIRGHGIKVDLPGVDIGVGSNGTHCPPGQAKKGRC